MASIDDKSRSYELVDHSGHGGLELLALVTMRYSQVEDYTGGDAQLITVFHYRAKLNDSRCHFQCIVPSNSSRRNFRFDGRRLGPAANGGAHIANTVRLENKCLAKTMAQRTSWQDAFQSCVISSPDREREPVFLIPVDKLAFASIINVCSIRSPPLRFGQWPLFSPQRCSLSNAAISVSMTKLFVSLIIRQ